MSRMEATKEATLLLELAIARSRASDLADEQTKARIREALEEAKRKILHLEERSEHGARLGLVLGGRSATDTERAEGAGVSDGL